MPALWCSSLELYVQRYSAGLGCRTPRSNCQSPSCPHNEQYQVVLRTHKDPAWRPVLHADALKRSPLLFGSALGLSCFPWAGKEEVGMGHAASRTFPALGDPRAAPLADFICYLCGGSIRELRCPVPPFSLPLPNPEELQMTHPGLDLVPSRALSWSGAGGVLRERVWWGQGGG